MPSPPLPTRWHHRFRQIGQTLSRLSLPCGIWTRSASGRWRTRGHAPASFEKEVYLLRKMCCCGGQVLSCTESICLMSSAASASKASCRRSWSSLGWKCC